MILVKVQFGVKRRLQHELQFHEVNFLLNLTISIIDFSIPIEVFIQ